MLLGRFFFFFFCDLRRYERSHEIIGRWSHERNNNKDEGGGRYSTNSLAIKKKVTVECVRNQRNEKDQIENDPDRSYKNNNEIKSLVAHLCDENKLKSIFIPNYVCDFVESISIFERIFRVQAAPDEFNRQYSARSPLSAVRRT